MLFIYYSSTFEKAYKKLPEQVQLSAEAREAIFRANPFDPRLRAHKLRAKLKGYWAFSIGYHYRIIFSFITDKEVKFHAIGTHSIYE